MYKHIAITGRIDTIDNLLAVNPRDIQAEYRLANAAPALRVALQGFVDAQDQRSKDVGMVLDDPALIAAARQLLNSL